MKQPRSSLNGPFQSSTRRRDAHNLKPRRPRARRAARTAIAAVAVLALVDKALAHVDFTSPDKGAVLEAGSMVAVSWIDSIPHKTLAYHLRFIPGEGTELIDIARDIPPTQRSWTWLVPADGCSDCSLLVIQDNSGSDYTSRLPITIASGLNTASGGAGFDDREVVGMHIPESAGASAEGGDDGGNDGGCALAPPSDERSGGPLGLLFMSLVTWLVRRRPARTGSSR